jgi:hypothetical protein
VSDDILRAELVALRAEVVKLRAENAGLNSALSTLQALNKRRLVTDYPKQMNEGESAKWTAGNQSAAQWGQDGGE